MNDKFMFKLAQIRSSYMRKKFGSFNNEEKALCDYEKLCLELIKEIEQLKEQLKDEEEQRIKIAKDREQTYKECLSLIEQKKELRSWLEDKLKDCDNYSRYIEKKIQELKSRSNGKTYITSEIMKNEVAKKCFKDVLDKLNELEGKNE